MVVVVDVDGNDVVELSIPLTAEPDTSDDPLDEPLDDPDDSVVPLEPAEPDDPDPDPDVAVPDDPDDPLDESPAHSAKKK